jgi:aconitate hydratase
MAAPKTLTQTLLARHRLAGDLTPGAEIDLRIEQTLTQDATGTLVMLELEAMGLDRVRTQRSVQYVDHNLVQQDFKNPDDHRFLMAACERFGVVHSRPGNGVSHPLHMQHFGRPGASLLGSDSHTPAAGALGMLAIGAGGLDVALAMAGEPYRLRTPEVFGVELTGALPDWVSAKDVILELLRRHGVRGAVGCVLEYHGSGLAQLDTWDRHVIANMGTELGATSTVFPSDEVTRGFLVRNGRAGAWEGLAAEPGCRYDRRDHIDLSKLEPLIARPSSPGDVVRVAQVAGEPVGQVYIGSSANPGFRDLAVAALIVEGERAPADLSFDINPATRAILVDLIVHGHLTRLLDAGARLHQAGCNGCIGMGQAPATDTNSLRTVPRNFPGRSGTPRDRVWLCSPETAAAAALRGVITDPRELGRRYPRVAPLQQPTVQRSLFHAPSAGGAEADSQDRAVARSGPLPRGPNIAVLPPLDGLPDALDLAVALRVGDDVSTDEIMPAGTRTLPLRSNIPRIAEQCFAGVDPGYVGRAREAAAAGGHLPEPRSSLAAGRRQRVEVLAVDGARGEVRLRHDLSPDEVATVLAGGRIPQVRDRAVTT